MKKACTYGGFGSVRFSTLSGGSKCTFGVFEALLRQEVLYFWRVSFDDVLLGCILPARTLHFVLSLNQGGVVIRSLRHSFECF